MSKQLKQGWYYIGDARFFFGRRFNGSTYFIMGDSYHGLLKKLEREYRDGVGLAD